VHATIPFRHAAKMEYAASDWFLEFLDTLGIYRQPG
jgi:hypothetical protein